MNKLMIRSTLVAIAASVATPMAASADTDGTVKLNGYNWNYYDKDDVNKTVTLGVRGSTGRDKANAKAKKPIIHFGFGRVGRKAVGCKGGKIKCERGEVKTDVWHGV